jgi:hypothetical protein
MLTSSMWLGWSIEWEGVAVTGSSKYLKEISKEFNVIFEQQKVTNFATKIISHD